VGHSVQDDAAAAGREAVLAAFAGSAPRPTDLVLLFPQAHYDQRALHAAALAAAAPAPVVGCTTAGAFTTAAQVPDGCVAVLLRPDARGAGLCHRGRGGEAPPAATARAAALCAQSRAGAERPYSVLLLLCDALMPDHRAVARGAYEASTALVPFVGGIAGDD